MPQVGRHLLPPDWFTELESAEHMINQPGESIQSGVADERPVMIMTAGARPRGRPLHLLTAFFWI